MVILVLKCVAQTSHQGLPIPRAVAKKVDSPILYRILCHLTEHRGSFTANLPIRVSQTGAEGRYCGGASCSAGAQHDPQGAGRTNPHMGIPITERRRERSNRVGSDSRAE